MMPDNFFFPNESELLWSVLIVLYPFLSGFVGGAFIIASMENIFRIESTKSTYRLALHVTLSILLIATLPLLLHLGHPERSYEIFITPNPNSAMAMFGYVYVWYLMAVIVTAIWFDYHSDMVLWARESTGWRRTFYRIATLGVDHLNERTREIDAKFGRIITGIGIPSAMILPGYVGFIFGSMKANPWWSSVLMPVIFIFSALVSGNALVMLIDVILAKLRHREINLAGLATKARFLLYIFALDFALEVLDLAHRLYEGEESIGILRNLMNGPLFISLFFTQFFIGTMVPIALIGITQMKKIKENPVLHLRMIVVSAALSIVGILAMRWNVVIGGQMFSKSLRGFRHLDFDLLGREGVLMAVLILCVPIVIFYVITRLLPTREDKRHDVNAGS